jgi:predicted Zn finger-like uncharacterized protein
MIVTCPSCGAQLRISDEHAGKTLKCPKCQGKFEAPQAAQQPQHIADPLDELASAASAPRSTAARRAVTRQPVRKSKAPVILGVVAVVVVIGIIIAIVSGPGANPNSMSLSDFKGTLRKISFFPESDGQLVISKERLIDTFGDPERVTQDPSGDMRIYYQIADGMVEIESVHYYWNGEEKYTYQGDSIPPKHPLAAKLEPHTKDGRLVRMYGGIDESDEYKSILVEWYLQSHQNPYEVVGPDETGRYSIHENGKYRYVDIRGNKKEKATLDAWVIDQLARDAQAVLNEELEKIEAEHRERNVKTIDEPCFPVLSIRVF